MKKVQGMALALTAAGALIGGQAEAKSATQQLGEEVCTYSQNILSGDPKDPNGFTFHGRGLLYPVIVDCSTTISAEANANGRIDYARSPSLSSPTTGVTRTNTIPQAESGVKSFSASINRPTAVGANVKPYYAPSKKPTITIARGSVVGNASAEGRKEAGDTSLIEANPVGNKTIAELRARDVRDQVLTSLRATGAEVTGEGNIAISSKIHPLNTSELGTIYAQSLRRNGNGSNRAMEEIAAYNAGQVNTPALEAAIGQKRYAEANLTYTATGLNRTVDTSNWNYAYWASILTALGLTGRKIYKKIKK